MEQEEFDRKKEDLSLEHRKEILRQASFRDIIQGGCDHLKENGKTRLAGQSFSDNSTHYLCTLCFKEFVEPDVPSHLRPIPSIVGGSGDDCSSVVQENIDWKALLEDHENLASVFREEALLYGTAYANAKRELEKHEELIEVLKHEALDGSSKL